jgi:hypothetical protein
MDIPAIVIHAIHIASVVLLIGGAFYTTLSRTALSAGMRARIFGGMALLVASGFYQFLAKLNTGPVPKGYHMWFGIKMLFALHILAVYLLLALGRGDEAKQRRWLGGIAISGLVAIVLASVLRSL